MSSVIRFCVCSLVAFSCFQAAAQDRKGPLAELGNQMASYGIQPHVLITNISMKNLDTGPRPHSFGNSGNVYVGADIDLAKLNGPDGATLHYEQTVFIFDSGTGQPTAGEWQGAAGTYFAGAPLHNDITSNQLSLLTYEQKGLDGQLDVHIGRTNGRRYFYFYNCETGVTCNDPILEASSGTLPPPFGAWGGYSKYHVNPRLYVHGGAFESNPVDYLKKRRGLDFSTDDASGTTFLLGIGSQPSKDRTQYELNAYFNSSKQVDPLTGESEHGTVGGFFKFRQTLWRDELKGLQAFGSLSASADKKQPFSHFAEAGLTYLGPFDRAQDKLNFKASYVQINDHQMQFQQRLRTAAGGNPKRGERNVYALEANGHFVLTRHLAVEPSIQYLINPDNFYNPGAPRLSNNGFVIGLGVTFDAGGALGL